jgi:hypothetical protein
MRDVHGRYQNQKPLTELAPAWACGCEHCHYGLVDAPPLTGAANLYLERVVQAIDKMLTFCTCQAGQRYRASLLNRRQAMIEEARRDPRLSKFAARLSHPDIENTRYEMHKAMELAADIPTFHFEVAA